MPPCGLVRTPLNSRLAVGPTGGLSCLKSLKNRAGKALPQFELQYYPARWPGAVLWLRPGGVWGIWAAVARNQSLWSGGVA
jgi:hypothetical protein